MRLNPKLIFVLSILCAVLAFFLTLRTIENIKNSSNQVLVVTVMTDLDVGDVIGRDDVKLLRAPKGTDMNVIFQDARDVIDKNARNPLRRGDVIRIFDVVEEGDNLAGLIPKGYRAAIVSLDISQETLKFLNFGNRVDVVFTDTDPIKREVETKTIMKNILVMKVSQDKGKSAQLNPNQVFAHVTLAVRPEGAELLSYAMNKGKIDLSVRPTGDGGTKEEYMSINDLIGTQKSALIPFQDKSPKVEIFRGVKKEEVQM